MDNVSHYGGNNKHPQLDVFGQGPPIYGIVKNALPPGAFPTPFPPLHPLFLLHSLFSVNTICAFPRLSTMVAAVSPLNLSSAISSVSYLSLAATG